MATIKHAANLNLEKTAEELKAAMKGFGCDEKAIIRILVSVDTQQRLQLADKYKAMYGEDLNTRLKSELGGHFEDVVLAAMQSFADFDAQSLRKAMKGAGTDESVLVEILCTKNNSEIQAIKQSYTKLFSRDLEKDIESETSGHFKRLMISLLQGRRSEAAVDRAKAQADANALHHAGEEAWFTDDSEFNRVFMTSSPAQLRAVCEEYKKLSSYDLDGAIKKEMHGNLEAAFRALVQTARNPAEFFAKKLHDAMHGAGTDDTTLIRCIVTRAEKDLAQIKTAYFEEYRKSLEEAIKSDCSGDYKHMLLALCGERI